MHNDDQSPDQSSVDESSNTDEDRRSTSESSEADVEQSDVEITEVKERDENFFSKTIKYIDENEVTRSFLVWCGIFEIFRCANGVFIAFLCQVFGLITCPLIWWTLSLLFFCLACGSVVLVVVGSICFLVVGIVLGIFTLGIGLFLTIVICILICILPFIGSFLFPIFGIWSFLNGILLSQLGFLFGLCVIFVPNPATILLIWNDVMWFLGLDEETENIHVEYTDQKYSEKQLKEIPLSIAEKHRIPSRINNPFYQVFYGFLYPFGGVYFVFKHKLYKYLWIEGSLCLTFFIVTTIVTLVTTYVISCGTLAEFALPIVIWLVDLIVQFFLSRGMERVSYLEEHWMKGSNDLQFGVCSGILDDDEDGDWKKDLLKKILIEAFNLSINLICKLIRQFFLFIVFPLTLLYFSMLIFPVGTVLYFIILLYILSMNFGYSSFDAGFLSRRHATFLGSLRWCFVENHNIILGYGLGSLVCYCIPFVNVAFYLFCSIGATRITLHLEEYRKLNSTNLVNNSDSDEEDDEDDN